MKNANHQNSTEEALAVIIPYYDGAEFLGRCLTSVWESDNQPGRVFIVDNDPTGLPAATVWRTHPGVQVIRTKPSLGFGRAVNVGVYTANQLGYRYFVVLNQDTVIDQSCFGLLLKAYMQSDGLRLISAMQSEYDEEDPSAHFRKYILARIPGYLEDEQSGRIQEIYIAHRLFGACFLFGSELLDELGLFDPVYEMYGEDDDLGHRIREAGGNILLCTLGFVQHKHSLRHATGFHRKQIQFWMLSSRLILRIRYTDMSRTSFVYRCLRLFAGALFTLQIRRAAASLKVMVLHLYNWKNIQLYRPQDIKSRIQSALEEDSQP